MPVSPAPLATDRPPPWLAIVAATLCLALLAGWLPHYLTWPWWPDLDAWATIAQGWDAGRLPYRDVAIFNFPGSIEVAWLLGHAFGWGRTMPAYALDAAALIGLGTLLIGWSRRRSGASLPGLIGGLALLHYYLGQDYAMVAQRDWHAPLLALGGLLILQAWPGVAGRLAAGGMLGFAMAIRPHAILFAPAQVLAIYDQARAAGGSRWHAARPLAEWAGGATLLAALAFGPLAVQGLLDDFLAGVRKASYGSRYSKTTVSGIFAGVLEAIGLDAPGPQFGSWDDSQRRLRGLTLLAVPAALGLLAARREAPQRRLARAWLLATIAALFYAPLHPKAHAYLAHPRNLVWCLDLAALAGLVATAPIRRRRYKAAALLGLLALAMPSLPEFWDPLASLDALGSIARPGEPARVPPGASAHWPPVDDRSPYRWEDYRQTLADLRAKTDPGTPVANLLRNVPFPAINGPVGRWSPLPGESGVIWLWSVEPEREPEYARALEASPSGTVAVWDPSRPTFDSRLELPNVAAVVRRDFRLEARFGVIEVWRKR